jgi:two-component system response regulator
MPVAPLLLVDDNPDDVDLTLRAFRKSNISNEVLVAHDGQQALDLLLPAGGGPGLQPAVVLLDLNMPRIDGLEVLRRLRADPRTRLLPVVVLTTSREDRDRIESYALGANSYVAKPVDFGEFMDAARTLSLYWALLNVPPPAA